MSSLQCVVKSSFRDNLLEVRRQQEQLTVVSYVQRYVVCLLWSYDSEAHLVVEGVREGADELGPDGLQVCLLVEQF